MIKQTLKAFVFGLLLVLLAGVVGCFGSATFFAVKAIFTSVGFEAVGLFFVGLLLLFMTLFCIVCLGAIPLALLQRKTEEDEEESDD